MLKVTRAIHVQRGIRKQADPPSKPLAGACSKVRVSEGISEHLDVVAARQRLSGDRGGERLARGRPRQLPHDLGHSCEVRQALKRCGHEGRSARAPLVSLGIPPPVHNAPRAVLRLRPRRRHGRVKRAPEQGGREGGPTAKWQRGREQRVCRVLRLQASIQTLALLRVATRDREAIRAPCERTGHVCCPLHGFAPRCPLKRCTEGVKEPPCNHSTSSVHSRSCLEARELCNTEEREMCRGT